LSHSNCLAGSVMQALQLSWPFVQRCHVLCCLSVSVCNSLVGCTCCADDLDDVADSVLPGGKDTVSICLITGFESFNISLYTKVHCILSHCLIYGIILHHFNGVMLIHTYKCQIKFMFNQFRKDEGHNYLVHGITLCDFNSMVITHIIMR